MMNPKLTKNVCIESTPSVVQQILISQTDVPLLIYNNNDDVDNGDPFCDFVFK